MEGAATQDFRGVAVGVAAAGEDEVLDAEEVALYQQDFGGIARIAAQPQGGGERGGGFAVVVEGDVGAVCGGDGVGDVLPKGVKVVEPQRDVVAVCCVVFAADAADDCLQV